MANQNQCTSFTNECKMFEFNAISCNFIVFILQVYYMNEFKMSNLKVFLIVSFFYIMMYTLMKLLNTLLCQTKHFVYLNYYYYYTHF